MKNLVCMLIAIVTITLCIDHFCAAAATNNRIICYAKANLAVYDVHGAHPGYGHTTSEAVAAAMADCRSYHKIVGCVPVPGCHND